MAAAASEQKATSALKASPLRFQPNMTNVVLFCIGSFAPVHLNHIAMFVDAKNALEKQPNTCVIAAYICITSSKQAWRKLAGRNRAFAAADTRFRVLRSTLQDCKDAAWLQVFEDGIDCDQPAAVRSRRLREQVQQHFAAFPDGSNSRLEILNVFGVDALDKIRNAKVIETGVCVFNRTIPGFDLDKFLLEQPEEIKSRLRLIRTEDYKTGARQMSSSLVRQRFFAEQSLVGLMTPSAIALLESLRVTIDAELPDEAETKAAAAAKRQAPKQGSRKNRRTDPEKPDISLVPMTAAAESTGRPLDAAEITAILLLHCPWLRADCKAPDNSAPDKLVHPRLRVIAWNELLDSEHAPQLGRGVSAATYRMRWRPVRSR